VEVEQLQNMGRLSDRIYTLVRQEILSGKFAPGQHLALEEIAQNLGVSTTPLRDALSLLAADGLVEWRPRRGAFVAHLTSKTLRETYQVREILECSAVDFAIARGAMVAAEMQSLATQIASAGEDGNAAMLYAHLELRFHTLPIECVGNSKLLDIYTSLSSPMTIAFALYPVSPRRNAEVLAEHQAIAAALAAGDAASAREATRTHLRKAEANILARLSDQEPPDSP